MLKNKLTWTLTLIILIVLPVQISGNIPMVKRIRAETAEGLEISVWTMQQEVKFGQDITIHYSVKNRSAQTIYLVSEDSPNIITDRGAIVVGEPVPSPDGHGRYDYHFSTINRGGIYQGKLVIPSSKYDKAKTWFIEMGFAYVTDITGLNRQLELFEDPLALRGQLFLRAVRFHWGGLTVKVVKT
jgi:hypothetical protein